MPLSSRFALQAGAFALAAAALGVSLWSARRPAPVAPAACDDGALREEVAALRRRLDLLAAGAAPASEAVTLVRRVEALEARAGAPTSHAPRPRPKFVGFRVPVPGVAVHSDDAGSLSVTNTDPSLTGHTFVVQAETEDGTLEPVTITVPPP